MADGGRVSAGPVEYSARTSSVVATRSSSGKESSTGSVSYDARKRLQRAHDYQQRIVTLQTLLRELAEEVKREVTDARNAVQREECLEQQAEVRA